MNILFYEGVTGMITGEQIRQLRTSRDWSQTEFGRRVGVNQATVSIWETGRNMVDRTTELAIYAVAAGLDEKPPALA